MDHPRFGMIPCERTTRPIKAGEELTLDYEYDPYNCPEWFEYALRNYLRTTPKDSLEGLNPKYHRFAFNEFGIRLRKKSFSLNGFEEGSSPSTADYGKSLFQN